MFPKNFFKDVDSFLSWGLGHFWSLKEGLPHYWREECLDCEVGCCDRVDVPELVVEQSCLLLVINGEQEGQADKDTDADCSEGLPLL